MATLEEVENGEMSVVESVEQGHSLPKHHDMEGETDKGSPRGRRNAVLLVVMMLLLAGAVVGLAVGLSKDSGSGSVSAASQSQNSGSSEKPDEGSFLPEIEEAGEEKEMDATGGEEMEMEETTGEGNSETTAPVVPENDATTTPVATEPTAETATTSVPLEARLGMIIDFLVNKEISARTDLETEDSPANKAAKWIATEDQLVLPVPGISAPVDVTRNSTTESADDTFVTRYLMALVYFATGGDQWTASLNFLSPKPTCEWYDRVGFILEGVGCMPDGRVVTLFLNKNMLKKQLPSEIGLLTDLVMLDLDTNWLQGSLPDSFAALTALEHLHIGSNGLGGPIPKWIGDLSSLRTLNLGFNLMTGLIPSEVTRLPLLEELALDHNQFEGDVNSLFGSTVVGLSPLRALFLDSNQFSGPLDGNFLASMDGLTQLDISDNAFTGTVPPHFFSFPKLEVLDIHDNAFTALPEAFPANCSIQFFAAQKNALVGSIPESIVELADLNHLDLSQNNLTGTIPGAIGEVLVGLNYLFLAENDFTPGPIPFTISSLFNLKELSLKSTARTGSIPPILGLLLDLEFLDLDNNELEGSIPSMIGSLPNLKLLLLNRNNLGGELPSELGNLAQLETLYLEGNAITGGLSATCASIPDDREVEIIAQCSLCDAVPGCCTQCCQEGEACNGNIHVADLDPVWQLNYERDDYTLHAEEWWMN